MRLGRALSASWEANKLIHPSTTNDEVEARIEATRPYFTGMKLLAAGGGGCALFASPTIEAADTVREILHTRFENNRARLVDMSRNQDGLKVSVS